ncbi:hypothetical protein Gotri_027341 [Gossypium trilobum]|uniref:Uncharacterized protein n=1 Tax=Gossypium trilobum TaxID=34281 RepID=A0A7J9FPQ7_9ROSI|nr:hypothetical protein [Gossypium trilobum]
MQPSGYGQRQHNKRRVIVL